MNKRRFVLVVLSSALWPLECLAQARMPKIGVLFVDNPEPAWTLLRDSLKEAGYVDKKNIQLEFRTANGNAELLAKHAAELVQANVDLIVANNTGAVQAAMQATKKTPIVMAPAGAPVETGLVKSLNRPGGNVTGVTSTAPATGAKTLEIMREIVPSLRRVAVLVNAGDSTFGKVMLDQVQSAATSMKIDVHSMSVLAGELDAAFAALEKSGAQAVLVQPSLPRARVAELGVKHRLPVIAPAIGHAHAGYFMSYAVAQGEAWRKAAVYVDRILKGANPATLPVEQLSRYELVINLKTARAIGLTVPASILARADKVIE